MICAQDCLGPVVVDLIGTQVTESEKQLIQETQVGGLILFSRNYESREQLQRLIQEVRSVRPNILIMVDQEGGRVQRFKCEFTRLPPLQGLGDLYSKNPDQGMALAYNHAWVMAVELLSLGVDLSLAPVLDADSCFSDVIGDRSFSLQVDVIIALAKAYIKGMNDAGMCATAKHFPGHGAVKLDSHKALPVDKRGLEDVRQADMRPFIRLSDKYAAVMPAHIVYEAVDTQPVGYSELWLQQILKKEVGFKGVVFSDDLSMEGAAVAGGFCSRADAALAAGCDAILVCNHPKEARSVIAHLKRLNHVPSNKLRALRSKTYSKARSHMNGDTWRQRAQSLWQFGESL